MGKPHFILRPKIHEPQLQWRKPEMSSAESPSIHGLFSKMEVWLHDVWINMLTGLWGLLNCTDRHNIILLCVIFDVDGLEVVFFGMLKILVSIDTWICEWFHFATSTPLLQNNKHFLEYDCFLRHLAISWKQFGITASWLESACCSNFMPIQVLLDLPVRSTGSLTKWLLKWIWNYFAAVCP